MYECIVSRRLMLDDTITDELVCNGLLPKNYKVSRALYPRVVER